MIAALPIVPSGTGHKDLDPACLLDDIPALVPGLVSRHTYFRSTEIWNGRRFFLQTQVCLLAGVPALPVLAIVSRMGIWNGP